ncbi:MAG: ABC transporter permease [Propionibacteriaceae bacterium]|jgi:putative ABC transport system permease protein|nr:ABC transporter permease [Propionibacteriaceae bacterium]
MSQRRGRATSLASPTDEYGPLGDTNPRSVILAVSAAEPEEASPAERRALQRRAKADAQAAKKEAKAVARAAKQGRPVQATLKALPKASKASTRSKALKQRRHLYFSDVVATATLGPRSRPVRALLSAIGIGIGITALVAVLGVPASEQATRRAELDVWGANVIEVLPGQDRQTYEAIPIPDTAPEMVARIRPVRAAFTIRSLPDGTYAYRNDKMSAGESGGITVLVGEGDPEGALNAVLAEGRWFDEATNDFPTVVLGATAAQRLRVGIGQQVWIAQSWWAVIGIFDPLPRYSRTYDSAVFLAPGWAKTLFSSEEMPIQSIEVNAVSGQAPAVRSVLAATVNPAQPSGVKVSSLSDLAYSQEQEMATFRRLALGLGAVALLVGGIGIANTMVVAVMERRGEIGLRRALGARTGQIGLQFVLEAAVIGLVGGLIGIALGAYAVFCYTAYGSRVFAIPLWVLPAGPAMAAAVGILAGLYPSLKAARQPPTTALRTV